MTESTATGWYYALNGERVGPRSLDEVRSMVATGVLDGDSLVWTTGMRDWARVGEIPLLSPEWAPSAPPPAPRAEAEHPARAPEPTAGTDDAPRPWHRLGARLVDTILFLLLAGLVLGIAAPEWFARAADPTSKPDPVLGFTLFLAVVPIEAVVTALFGTTPGKAMAGIRVVTQDGGRLNFGQAFSRAARVVVLGLGLGLTPLTLLAGIMSFLRLRSRGITLWDEHMELRVEHTRASAGGAMALGAILLLFFIMMSIAAARMGG